MSPAAQALLRLEALEKRFVASADGEGPHVLRGVDLELEAGERCAIVGPSGSGKSTLLHLVGGLAAPSAGRVLVDGEDLASFGEERLAQFRNQRIGLVFQEAQLLPQLSALENALLPARELKVNRPAGVGSLRSIVAPGWCGFHIFFDFFV